MLIIHKTEADTIMPMVTSSVSFEDKPNQTEKTDKATEDLTPSSAKATDGIAIIMKNTA